MDTFVSSELYKPLSLEPFGILEDSVVWDLKLPFDSLPNEPVPYDSFFLDEQIVEFPLVPKSMVNLTYVDLKNPISFDSSLRIDDDAWGWEPQEKVMSKETDLTSMALQHDRATKENSKKPRGRPKGSKNSIIKPTEQEERPPKRIRRCVRQNFKLPEGWAIRENLRRNGRTAGHVDKTYIEPGTGRSFRSLPEVEAHLENKEKAKEGN
ncbi:hypothetical protein M9H77_13920 [Catharanthus roseus]|uniref:Uncharacterized protein n=1 Tax=Catharanthus roseus TaxID=4058 RepID=A0ACC0BLT5_CATRO|nr:hypothetical protein M9H77_13920 [Catharanthus roseus]